MPVSGESNIRQWIIENDWLEADRRAARPALLQHRHLHLHLDPHQPQANRVKGKVTLINARELRQKMRKSLGNKRNEITPAAIADDHALYSDALDIADERSPTARR